MDFSQLNKHFSTENKTPRYKQANRVLTIWMLISIALSMVAVWGDVVDGYFYSSSYYEFSNYSSSLYVGIECYLYSGWKFLTANNMGVGNYICLILIIIMFIATLFITYVFGIKAFIKGLKNFSAKEDITIFPYFVLISLANYVYFTFGATLSGAAFAFDSVTRGWGSGFAAFAIIPAAFMLIISNVVFSFNKEKIPEFVGKIFLAVSIWIAFGIISYDLCGYFAGTYDDYIGIVDTFNFAFLKQYNSLAFSVFTIHGIVEILISIAAFITVVQTIYVVCCDYPTNKKCLLIAPIVLFALISLSLFTNAYTQELYDPNANISVNSNVINSFVIVFILLTINVTNFFLINKEK